MTKQVLIIDAGCKVDDHGGTLNHAFADLVAKTLESLGWRPDITRIDDGWCVENEVEKVLKADLLISELLVPKGTSFQNNKLNRSSACLSSLLF